MDIKIEPTIKNVLCIIEEYCEGKSNNGCPNECIFDKVGVCTEANPISEFADKCRYYLGIKERVKK